MRVIFLEDVKGKGKKFEEKDIAAGYALFLIKSKKVVQATKENVAEITRLKNELETSAAEDYFHAMNVVDDLKATEIIIRSKSTPNGTLQKSLTKEDILNSLPSNAQYYINHFAPHAIEMKPIKTFGKHEIKLNLFHSDFLEKGTVKTTINVSVVEE